MLELEYASGLTSPSSTRAAAVQRERAYASFEEADQAYVHLLAAVVSGDVDPAQPVFRQDLED